MTNLTISAIEAIPVAVPMKHPIKWARGAIRELDHVIVVVRLSNGVEGIGDAAPRPTVYGETQRSIVEIIQAHLAPRLMGLGAFETARCTSLMAEVIGNLAAKAAVDIALHDACGKTLGISCAEMLGGRPRPIPLNWRIRSTAKSDVLAEAERMMHQYGFRALKMKCGLDIPADISLLEAVRHQVGDDVEISVDMNQAYTPDQLLTAIPELERLGIALIEEPLPARDRRGKLLAAQQTRIPFTGDDSCTTLDDVRDELELGAIRSVVIKCVRTGFTISREILALTKAFHCAVHNGSNADMHICSMASAHFACAYETSHAHEMSYFADEDCSVVDQPIELKDGCMIVPDRPGIGLGLDAKMLAKYRVD